MIDVLPARSAVAVTGWLAGIRHVVIDPYQPYATALAKGLPAARLVADPFHVVRVRHEALCVRGWVRGPPHRSVAAGR